MKYLDDMCGEDIVRTNILNGIALVDECDDALNPIRHYYLGDTNVAARAATAVTSHATA